VSAAALVSIVIGVAVSAAALVSIVIGGVVALARLQARIVDAVIAGITGVTGIEYEADSEGVRLLVGAAFGAVLFGIAYVALLIGAHIVTLVTIAVIGCVLSVALGCIASLKGEEQGDYLSRLRFWDDEP
jgi:amino acid transporter